MKAVKEKKKKVVHDPLDKQMRQDRVAKRKESTKGEKREKAREGKYQQDFISGDLSKKILTQARQQLDEEDADDFLDNDEDIDSKFPTPISYRLKPSSRGTRGTESDEEEAEEEFSEDEEAFNRELELNPEEERAMQMFMSHDQPQRRTLADIVMDKIREKEAAAPAAPQSKEQVEEAVSRSFDPKVVAVYKGVGQFLKSYRSGKIPKAFKIIPSLQNWEEVLYLTTPEEWSPAAVYQSTRLFASNLNQKMAQRFYNLIILPRVREDISANKRLNFWLYQALKKSLYKSAAFYKGILLPLCEVGNCTLHEAIIIGSVMAKVSIPVLQSAAALLKLAEMHYSGANSLFIRILLDKKYALPYRVLSGLVHHFLAFANDPRQLPVLWHQSLLAFVQRYKNDLNEEQKDAIRHLIRKQTHHLISDEIRRELTAADRAAPMAS